MSDAHKEFADAVDGPIREAIEKELSNRGGGMLTGYLGIFTYIDEDGERCWSRIGQVPMIEACGLADVLQMSIRDEARDTFGWSQ